MTENGDYILEAISLKSLYFVVFLSPVFRELSTTLSNRLGVSYSIFRDGS